MRIIKNNVSTVGELVDILKRLPSDYSLSITGMNVYHIAIDDKNKSILIDDPKWIEEAVDEKENEYQ